MNNNENYIIIKESFMAAKIKNNNLTKVYL